MVWKGDHSYEHHFVQSLRCLLDCAPWQEAVVQPFREALRRGLRPTSRGITMVGEDAVDCKEKANG